MRKEKIVLLIELSVMFLICFLNLGLIELLIYNPEIQKLRILMLYSESTFRILCSLITYILVLILCIVLFRKNVSVRRYSQNKIDQSFYLYIGMITLCFSYRVFSCYYLGKSIGNPFRSNFASILFFISFVCIGPFVEEYFFRKILQRNLINQFHVQVKFAIILQAVLFFACHIHNNTFPIDTLLIGILFGVIYEITKNILYTVVFHSSVNLSLYLFQAQILHVRHALSFSLHILFYCIFMMLMIILVFLYIKMKQNEEYIDTKIT